MKFLVVLTAVSLLVLSVLARDTTTTTTTTTTAITKAAFTSSKTKATLSPTTTFGTDIIVNPWRLIPVSSLPSYVLATIAQEAPSLVNETIAKAYTCEPDNVHPRQYAALYGDGTVQIVLSCSINITAANGTDPSCTVLGGDNLPTTTTTSVPADAVPSSTSSVTTMATTQAVDTTTVPKSTGPTTTITSNIATESTSTVGVITSSSGGANTEVSIISSTNGPVTKSPASSSPIRYCAVKCVELVCGNGQCRRELPRAPGSCCPAFTCDR